jgi:Raf kinase inhibitor-like YbhB/YbcL family protein
MNRPAVTSTESGGSMFALIVASSLLAAAATAPKTASAKFTLTSPEVKPGATLPMKQVFNGMGCEGENISPELAWSNAPVGTKSFVVTVYDPDAPTGSGWWHWVAYNIPADAKGLAAGAGSGKAELPAGTVQGKTDFGQPGFGGACPPQGDKPHHYIFTVYAEKTDKLEVPEGASAAMIGYMTHANNLAKATFTATYGRPAEKAKDTKATDTKTSTGAKPKTTEAPK